jgi:FSR family fosmidomycin resistance protein-like MFS transporter
MSSRAATLELTDRLERSRPALPPLILFSCGHFFIDLYSIALGVLQPLLLMVWLGGAGIGSFHPQATANAILGITSSGGRAMATLISAGTLGLSRTYWAAIPGVLMTMLMLSFLRLTPATSGPKLSYDFAPLRAIRRPLTILFFLVVIRSIVQVTFAQFLPLYLKFQQGYSLANASYITSAYLLAGALGGFTGGTLADRFGGRRIILLSMICSVPFLLLFVFTTGWISIAGFIVGGLILLFTIPVNVMMGQELAPANARTVSALMMGAAWGTAGMVFIPLTGWVALALKLPK